MKKEEKKINDYLRNEIINQIKYLNTNGLIIILDTIYDLRTVLTTYKDVDKL